MLGNFQQSQLRIEVEASETAIGTVCPSQLQQWLWPQRFAAGMPEQLDQGLAFTSWTGPSLFIIKWRWRHPMSTSLLSQGIDGFHEWYWGEAQSRLEGVSILPLNLGQTLNLSASVSLTAH